mgnify:FL=1
MVEYLMALTVPKNPTQLFQYRQNIISGEQFKDHMSHLRTADMHVGQAQPGTTASTTKQ